MTTRAEMRQRLRTKIVDNTVGSYKHDDEVVDDALDEALRWHNPAYSFSELPIKEEYAVLLLAWRGMCLIKASQNADFVYIGTSEGSLDKSQRVRNWGQMAEYLRQEYDGVCIDLGIGHGGDEATIFTGTLLKTGKFTDAHVPDSLQPPPVAVTLSDPSSVTTTTAVLSWTEAKIRDFYSYTIYRHTVTGLKDMTTLTTSGSKYKGVIDAATKVDTIYYKHLNTLKVTGLTTGTKYFFVIVVEDRNARIAVSNEVNATQS